MSNVNVITTSLLWLLLASVTGRKAMHFSQSYQDHLKVMQSLVDDFYDPCEDFFQHACGYYDTQVAPIAPFMYNKEAAVQFFENNRANFSTTGGILLNGLYESCKNKNWDLSQWKELDFLAEFSKWPFLHYQWAEAGIETTWPQLAAHLAARGVPIFFDVFFAPNTIYVSPADVFCPSSQKELRKMIMSPATSVVRNQIADIISSELWSFCRELTGEEPSSSERSSQESSSEAETNEFFHVFFSTLGFTPEELEDSRKIQIRTKRLEQILSIVRRTDSRIVINFIIWKMIEALQYEDCFHLTDEFEPLLLSEYWQWSVFTSKIRKEVAMANFLFQTSRFQKRRKDLIMANDWMSFLDRKLSQRDLNIERLMKNYAKKKLSAEVFDSDYSKLEMHRDSFHYNYFTMKSRQLRLTFVQDNYIDKEDTSHPLYFLKKFLNFVIITANQPLFHYFSTEGFGLWYDSDLLFSTDDLYTAIDCLDRQSEVYGADFPIFGNLTTDQVEEIVKLNRALYEIYYDYFFWLEGEIFSFAEDYVLEHFNLNSSRVLFYSVAQLHCGRDDSKYGTLINRSFMNSVEFQNAFECDIDLPMNPALKCLCKNC